MPYTIESIDLFIRETREPRFDFGIGRQGGAGKSLFPPFARGMVEVRMQVASADGRKSAFGCAGDWPSYGWLDKRPGREALEKLSDLLSLVRQARDIYAEQPGFESVFDKWHASYERVITAGRSDGHEDLSSAFASALFERAMMDAVCRLEGKTFFEMVKSNGFGMRPGLVHPELQDFDYAAHIVNSPRTKFHIRHTVGFLDPLRKSDLLDEDRLNDGEPETLEEYIERDGLNHFKIKISGEPDRDLARLREIWAVASELIDAPVMTLDGNEAYLEIAPFEEFVRSVSTDLPEMFERILCIEQPLPRSMTLDPSRKSEIQNLAEWKPLMIDEADALIGSFREAAAIGYSAVSHKNCKGVFKSLMNHAYCLAGGRDGLFLSGEDLTSLPYIALQQDFAALGVLNLTHCERNGHHYFYGLAHLTESERREVLAKHGDLYELRENGEGFMKMQGGSIECASINSTPGFGVCFEPEWESLAPLEAWMSEILPQ